MANYQDLIIETIRENSDQQATTQGIKIYVATQASARLEREIDGLFSETSNQELVLINRPRE